MSTRAAIGIKNEQGITAMYCHYDGYPSHVGKVLQNHFKTLEQVKEIVKRAPAVRSLSPEGEIERFDEDISGQYRANDPQEALAGFDYLYLFENDAWTCYKEGRGGLQTVAIPA